MRLKLVSGVFLGILALAACTPAEQKQVQDVLEELSSSSSSSVTAESHDTIEQSHDTAEQSQYTAYSPEVLADGKTKVLFFHASWCPVCKADHVLLQQWYTDFEVPVSVYKVDYDTSVELKQKYGVTYQHTYIKVDGQGNMIDRVQGPTDEALKDFLAS